MMARERTYALEEFEEETFRDIFDIKNEPLLGLQPTTEPGARGSIRAVEGEGPENIPTLVAYPGHPAYDTLGGPWFYWSAETQNWRQCP